MLSRGLLHRRSGHVEVICLGLLLSACFTDLCDPATAHEKIPKSILNETGTMACAHFDSPTPSLTWTPLGLGRRNMNLLVELLR